MHFSTSLGLATAFCTLLVNAAVPGTNLTVDTVHQFPAKTWVENLAVRECGSILSTTLTGANIYETQPNGQTAILHSFSNATGVLGITEHKPDVFFAVTGNFSFQTFSPLLGSYSIYRIDFTKASAPPTVKLHTTIAPVQLPNGLTSIPNQPYILIADSLAGLIWRLNIGNNELSVYFDHPLLKNTGGFIKVGVDGVKISGDYLYFSNGNQQLLARVPIQGAKPPTAAVQMVANNTQIDDFFVNPNGDIYIAENGANRLSFVQAGSAMPATPMVIAGSADSTVLAGPTAVQWGRGNANGTLYISTNGGAPQYFGAPGGMPGTISSVEVF